MTIMMIFNISTSYFHKISFLLFLGLLHDETDLKVRYMILCEPASKGYTLSCLFPRLSFCSCHKQFEGREKEP
jgi:hypothetical protein